MLQTKFKFQQQKMAGVHKFRIGDPVWAKMKGFSPWPGKVCLPPTECKRPAVKKQMHCVHFFGTNDFAWIEEVNMKDYAQYKTTFVKPKQSKAIGNAIEDIENYCKDRGDPTGSAGSTGGNQGSEEEEEEEFDALISGAPSSTKVVSKKPSNPRKREGIREAGGDSDSSASGPSSSTAKKVKVGRPQLKERQKEEPSSTHSEGEGRASPAHIPALSKKSSAIVSGLLDRPTLARPVSPSVGMDLVTSSQILREKDIQPSKLNFGFLGLGIMGSGIVKNLLNSGHSVTVWNRTVEKVRDFVEAGAKEALTPSDVIAESDITFSCVSDPQAAKDLVFGNCGVLQEINTTKGYVEMTGMDSDTSQVEL
jgi:3-hydroxyisobutyrate dehydrogenase